MNRTSMRFKMFKLFSVVFLSLCWPSLSKAHDLYSGTASVFVSYANGRANSRLDKSPKINMSFDGSNRRIPLVMDTGSVGIIVSADLFTPAPNARNLGPGRQFYTSSGIIEEGTWWSSGQKIYDAEGVLLATSEVPVLRVTSIRCADNARSCHPKKHPKGVAMMGIGFGRESEHQVRGTPAYNPFLNIKTILQTGKLKPLPNDWHSGYVVTSTGVHLGLTSANTANAGFVKLDPWPLYSTPGLPEWKAAPMTINVNGVSEAGHILMDTGVGTAYLTPPILARLGKLIECPGKSLRECAPPGSVISIYLPDQQHPIARYSYTIGQKGNPMQPIGTHIVKRKGSESFLNSGRHVLEGINFFYDNINGYMGYIWNGKSSHAVGYVKPTPPPLIPGHRKPPETFDKFEKFNTSRLD